MQVDNDYQIAFKGTTPKSLRFKLHDSAGTGSKLRILYADVGAYDVYKFAKKIEPNKWNDKEGGQEQISKKKGCGENRMVGGKNGTYLEIFIAPGIGCSLTISPRDALVVSIRMTWRGGHSRLIFALITVTLLTIEIKQACRRRR